MNALITPHDVLLRFAQVRRAILTHRLLAAVGLGACVFLGFVLVMATIDFFAELPRAALLAGVYVAVAAAVLCTVVLISRALRLGASRRAAAEMERHFETIGQRLRTTLDLAGRSGVDKLPLTLALATETNEQCDSVKLEGIVTSQADAVVSLGTGRTGRFWVACQRCSLRPGRRRWFVRSAGIDHSPQWR